MTIMLGYFCFEAIWKSETGDFQLEPLHILEDKPSKTRKIKPERLQYVFWS